MEPNEDSIKLLEMRIRHQMNHSLEKKIMPENIHYYLPSSAARRLEELEQDVHGSGQGQPRQKIHIDGKGNLWQEIQVGETSELQRNTRMDAEADFGRKTQPDMQPDGYVRGLQEAYGEESMPAGQQEGLPFDAAEYIDRAGEISQIIEHMELFETKEAQHARARNGYESARRSMDEESFSGIGKSHFLDAKG